MFCMHQVYILDHSRIDFVPASRSCNNKRCSLVPLIKFDKKVILCNLPRTYFYFSVDYLKHIPLAPDKGTSYTHITTELYALQCGGIFSFDFYYFLLFYWNYLMKMSYLSSI